MTTLDELSEALALAPHPEGGRFRETHRGAGCTAILYALGAGETSAFHRVVGADEVWHFYEGDALVLHTIGPEGYARAVLGPRTRQAVVPAGTWQAAEPLSADGDRGFSLMGCTVAPPFSFERFEMAQRAALTRAHPRYGALIARLTHP